MSNVKVKLLVAVQVHPDDELAACAYLGSLVGEAANLRGSDHGLELEVFPAWAMGEEPCVEVLLSVPVTPEEGKAVAEALSASAEEMIAMFGVDCELGSRIVRPGAV